MKKTITTKSIALFLAAAILFSSCASTTIIRSEPSGAKVYLNGEYRGKTPYSYTDTKIIGSSTSVKLTKEGYEPLFESFSRNEEADVGAIIAGILVWVPFLWTMKYKPYHAYELVPYKENYQTITQIDEKQDSDSKIQKLRDLKQLLDEKVITKEEFQKEKSKILNGK